MLKALLRKQFLELGNLFFQSRKPGKRRSRGQMIGLAVLFGFLFVLLSFAFFGIGMLFADAMLPVGLDWLYFAMMGMIAIFLGVVGDVFTTYSTLYQAKDNELLLAMPIPPSKILFSRMVSVYAMGLLFTAMGFLPAVLVYWIEKPATVLTVILPLLLLPVLGVAVLVLSCVLGWVVALIASRVRSKSVITVLVSLLLVGVYYVCYFRINAMLQSVVERVDEISGTVRVYLYPFYQMGLAASGSLLSMLIFTAIVGALFALTVWVLSRTFLRLATANRGAKKTVYREEKIRTASPQKALLRRELKHFSSSAAYMLNCGLGLVIMVIVAVLALVNADTVAEVTDVIRTAVPTLGGVIPTIAAAAVILITSMNAFTAPSVSLEGKRLWIVRSLPVSAWEILRAKLQMHVLLNFLPTVLATVAFGIVTQTEATTVLLMTLLTLVYVCFSAALGLTLDLRKPNLDWNSETVPVKQNVSVLITMFGGWGIALLIGGGGYLLREQLEAREYLLGAAVILAMIAARMIRRLKNTGEAALGNL